MARGIEPKVAYKEELKKKAICAERRENHTAKKEPDLKLRESRM